MDVDGKKMPQNTLFSLSLTNKDLINFNNHFSLFLTRISIFDFWLLELAMVETIKTLSKRLKWILNDIDNV